MRKQRELKPLDAEHYKMDIIRDMGMVYKSKKGTRKYRTAEFKCNACGKPETYTVDSARYKEIEVCLSCSYKTRSSKTRIHIKGQASSHRLYRIYRNMNTRCKNKTNRDFPRYGGRGIKNTFKDYPSFRAWAMSNGYCEDLTIDRRDNDGNYSEENCRWVTGSIQMCNQRQRESKSGLRGVVMIEQPKGNKYEVDLKYKNKRMFRKRFDTPDEAVTARNAFITENNLPHKLTIVNL